MAQGPSTPDLPVIPSDTLELHRTGNAVVTTFQTSGLDSTDGLLTPTHGNADARAVFESTTRLNADQLSQQIDGLQARAAAANLFSADGMRDSTAAIAHMHGEGNGTFKLVAAELSDSQVMVARLNPEGQVISLDRAAAGSPSTLGANNFDMNGVKETSLVLGNGERAIVLVASDGLADGYMARSGRMDGAATWQDLLKKDIEFGLRADPTGNGLASHLAASSIGYGVTDNVSISSVALSHDTNLGGKSLTLAVFDGTGHTDGTFSSHLARDLQVSMTGQSPILLQRQDMAHISERPGVVTGAVQHNAINTLRDSGNWIIGAVDQEGGGFRPAVLLDTSKMTPQQLSQTREALHTLGGNWDVRENYLSNPITGSRSTIGLEGHASLGGVESIHQLVQGPLKGATVEWSDDKRAWVGSHDHSKPYVSPGALADHEKPVTVKPDAAAAFRAQVAAVSTAHTTPAEAEPVKAAKKVSATVAKASVTAGRAQSVADASVKLASGDVAGAAVSAGTAVGMEAAQSGKFAAALGAVKLVGKRIPGVGAIVTAGFGVAAVGSLLLAGEYKKAGVEAVASAAEAGGNIAGFGVGDGAREGVRGAAIAAGGKEYEVAKSGLRELGESAVELASGPSKPSAPKAVYTPPPPSNAAPTRTFNAQAKLPEDMQQAPAPVAPARRPGVTNGMTHG